MVARRSAARPHDSPLVERHPERSGAESLGARGAESPRSDSTRASPARFVIPSEAEESHATVPRRSPRGSCAAISTLGAFFDNLCSKKARKAEPPAIELRTATSWAQSSPDGRLSSQKERGEIERVGTMDRREAIFFGLPPAFPSMA
jgi:hypothetical protein